MTFVNTPMRDAQDNDMFYYFLADSLTNEFRTTVLLYADVYSVTNTPQADNHPDEGRQPSIHHAHPGNSD